MNVISQIITPRERDLGGFTVGRVLPHAKRRMVGPFIFFDEMGPAVFPPGKGIDVRPHPHIGLATVTYLFDGQIRHQDNLGVDQLIEPGDVNWMTAGSGVVHSERTADDTRAAGHKLHGIQSWVALPTGDAEIPASFHHHPSATLPLIVQPGANLRVIVGDAFGTMAPVQTYSPIFYVDAQLEQGAAITLPAKYEERAVYVVEGEATIGDEGVGARSMAVVEPGADAVVEATAQARMMLLGGAPLGPRVLWWNFVAADEARLERAKDAWRTAAATGFNEPPFTLPPGESEHITLPDA